MNLKTVIDVCEIRQRAGRSCRDCSYYGKTCNHAKKILKVEKPFEYTQNINKEEN